MYAQRMTMDPRFAYPVHISRHRDPNLNQLPHNFNMQVGLTNYAFLLILFPVSRYDFYLQGTFVKT